MSTPSSAVPGSGRRALVPPSGPGAVLADALPGGRVRDLALVVAYAALVGVFAQLVVPLPFTPVPITGQTFAVLLGAGALGWRRALNGMLLYAVAGLVGVPWFARSAGGLEALSSATFGYILGFVIAAMVVGGMAGRGWDRHPLRAAAMLSLGTLIVYAFGLPWLMATKSYGLGRGLSEGVVPLLLGDPLKILLAAGLLPGAWALLRRRG